MKKNYFLLVLLVGTFLLAMMACSNEDDQDGCPIFSNEFKRDAFMASRSCFESYYRC